MTLTNDSWLSWNLWFKNLICWETRNSFRIVYMWIDYKKEVAFKKIPDLFMWRPQGSHHYATNSHNLSDQTPQYNFTFCLIFATGVIYILYYIYYLYYLYILSNIYILLCFREEGIGREKHPPM